MTSPIERYFHHLPLHRLNYITHYSERYKYIYVETAKVACSSIKYYLQYLEVDGDTSKLPENPHMRGQSPLPRLIVGNNRPVFEAALESDDYFLFSFVRNPYTRALSCYLDKIVGSEYERNIRLPLLGFEPTDDLTFEQFLEAVRKQPIETHDIHWSPQWFTLGLQNGLKYDFLGRFEYFKVEFENVLDFLQGENRVIEKTENRQPVRTNAVEKVQQYYTATEKELVDEIYQDDFRYFGYGHSLDVI